jgi:hypothetical protein
MTTNPRRPLRVRRRCGFILAAALALTPAVVQAENLFTNPNFDDNLAGWTFSSPSPEFSRTWSSVDAGGSPSSGSARATVTSPGFLHGPALFQCVSPIVGGQSYRISGEVLIPPGGPSGAASVNAYWHTLPGCVLSGSFAVGLTLDFNTVGVWTPDSATAVLPAGAKSLFVQLNVGTSGGTSHAHFDHLQLCRTASCEDTDDGWLTSSEFPDFRFRVQFTTSEGPFYGAKESDCLPDTLCVSSELRGRTAVLLRIIGPRPNGYLWFQATRFPAQQADIEVQQLSTGIVKTYRLERLDPDDTEIPGRLDRTAFRP